MSATNDNEALRTPESDDSDVEQLLLTRSNPYSQFLPYADQLEQEADQWFAEIKRGLAHSVETCDLKTSGNSWSGQLLRYLRVYGRRFNKEEHISMVKLLYAIVCDTKLDIQLICKYADLLARLLKKPDLIRPSELELDWRPLYELFKHVAFNKHVTASIVSHPENALKSVISTVRSCRVYFPVHATQGLLDEMRPFLSPFTLKFADQMNVAELFLPTVFEHESDRTSNVALWFDDLARFFLRMYNNDNKYLIQLLARLAQDSVGRIDWMPYMRSVFTRTLRTFNLPVGEYHLKPLEEDDEVDTLYFAAWVLAFFGGNSPQSQAAFVHLEGLLTAIGSFAHPSNAGRWTQRINKFIAHFTELLTERLFRERFKSKSKRCWFMLVPAEVFISDDDVTRLVDLLKPVVLQTMFGKQVSIDVFTTLRLLANLRPERILPSLLERVWPAFETLTEPHRLHSGLQALLHTSRALTSSSRFFPEGRLHVIPILNACLPGIDFNDISKCLFTFQLISSIVAMVPLVNCSELANQTDRQRLKMTALEFELCAATAQMEDFLEQFLSRTFSVIEANTLNFQSQSTLQSQTSTSGERLNMEESILEIGIASTFVSMLQSASAALRKRAVRKLFDFVCENVFEIKLSGRLISKMCKSAAKVDSALVVPIFVPYLLKRIDEILQSDEFKDQEEPDDRLLWFFKLMGELAAMSAEHLIAYRRELISVLQRTLHLKCTSVTMLACDLLSNSLYTVSQTHPSNAGWSDDPQAQEFPVRLWGSSISLRDLKVSWRFPTAADCEFVREILATFLPPELKRIDKLVSREIEMKKEELASSLDVIGALLEGASSFLDPLNESDVVQLGDGAIAMSERALVVAKERQKVDLQGQNVRKLVLDCLLRLADHLETHRADDTKSFRMLLDVLYGVLGSFGIRNDEQESRIKGQKAVKRMMENRLAGKKRHLRMVHVERCILQHTTRLAYGVCKRFTALHRTVFQLLFRLSVNRYSEVRKKAQQVLFKCCATFWYSTTLVIGFASDALDSIVTELRQLAATKHVGDKDSGNERKKRIDCKLEGVVHTVYGLLKNNQYAMTYHSAWRARAALWPKLMQIEHPDRKLTAQIDELIDRILKNANTVHLANHFDPNWFSLAQLLHRDPQESEAQREARLTYGREYLTRKNQEQKEYYVQVERDLLTLLRSATLSSKHVDLTAEFLAALIQPDIPVDNVDIVRCFLELSINEVHSIRSLCLDVLLCILMLQKRKRVPLVRNAVEFVREFSGQDLTCEQLSSAAPGVRKDNAFLCFDGQVNVYESEEAFALASRSFLDKSYLSFYCWPPTVNTFVAQNGVETRTAPAEAAIVQFFTDERNLGAFFRYLADEDHRKYTLKNMHFFKYFFRNFGFASLQAFKPFVERLVYESNEQRVDFAHRTAAEFLAGLLHGAIKQFSMPQLVELWRWVLPLLEHVLNANVVGAHDEWATAFAAVSENVDPRRLAPLIALLLNLPVTFSQAGQPPAIRIDYQNPRLIVPGKRLHQNAMRISFLHAFLNQQDWRMPRVWHMLLETMKADLDNSYKLIRDRIGTTFATMFAFDVQLGEIPPHRLLSHPAEIQPRAADFVQFVLPRLNSLCTSSSSCVASAATEATAKSDTESVGSFVVVDSKKAKLLPSEMESDESTSSDDIEMLERSDAGSPETEEDVNAKNIRLLKTVLRMLLSIPDNAFDFNVDFFRLLPAVCYMHSEQASSHPELRQLTTAVIQTVSTVHLGYSIAQLNTLLDVFEEIGAAQPHSAKKALLLTIQALIYHNLMHFMQSPALVQRIAALVVHLLQDTHAEVRVRASSTLSGFLRCGLIQIDATLLSTFDRLSSTKLQPVRTAANSVTQFSNSNSPALISKHAGVLGYCACVEAFPYDVPAFLPGILMKLNAYLNDPQPINTTIRKTLSNFKRTHYDNWYEHKQKFTDDQLVVITDMLISPNYYA